MSNCRLHHIAIQTANFDKAYNFYTKILNLSVVKAPFNFKNKRIMAWLSAGNALIELYTVKKGTQPQPYDDQRVGTDHIAFAIDNMDALLERLKENKITILKGPFIPAGDKSLARVVFIEGPDGEEIELTELKEGEI